MSMTGRVLGYHASCWDRTYQVIVMAHPAVMSVTRCALKSQRSLRVETPRGELGETVVLPNRAGLKGLLWALEKSVAPENTVNQEERRCSPVKFPLFARRRCHHLSVSLTAFMCGCLPNAGI